MQLIYTSILFDEREYFFNKFFGSLLSHSKKKKTEKEKTGKKITKKDLLLLEKINKPYNLNCQKINTTKVMKINNFIKLYTRMIVFICKHSFFLARLLTKIRIPIFENSEEAIAVFRKITKNKNQSDLCLPRSFFAAVTSKKFKNSGTMFIGVFLPSTSMHAWVIEDNKQADFFDNIWINYQPVAVLYT